jgi:hypothetical protein
MNIETKLFFEFKKEYTELLASDVSEFIATKNYAQDILDFKTSLVVSEVQREGKVPYTTITKDSVPISNFRGDVERSKQSISEDGVYSSYLTELADFVFAKIQSREE